MATEDMTYHGARAADREADGPWMLWYDEAGNVIEQIDATERIDSHNL